MAVRQRNIHTDYRLIGVFASAAAYLADRNKSSATKGDHYYDTTLNQTRSYDGSSWSPVGQNGNSAGSLNDASIIGAKITSTQAIEIEASASASNLFILDANGTTNTDIFDISSAGGSGHLINFTQNGTGKDIDGTSSLWSVSKAGLGVFDGGLTITADSKALTFGTSSDLTMQFVDAAPGSVGSGLLIAGSAAAEQVQFGNSTYGVDVWFEGTSDTNYMLWDSSANELILEAVDLGLQDSDLINFGDNNDITMTFNGTDFLWDGAAANTIIKIGASNNQDLIIYGATTTNLITFDTDDSALLCHFDGFDLQMKDADKLLFGDLSGGDLTMEWDASNFLIEAGAQDTGQIRIGSTNAIDFVIYNNAATGTITNDVSTSTVDINAWDIRLQDDDYLLLGDSSSAGGTTDGTIRWDATNSTIEVVGAIQFEDNVTMDGNLALSGTLTMSGALAPGSITLGDTEILSFGDGVDYKISTAGSTAALIVTAVNADDSINIGDGSVRTDFLIDNATVAGADVWFDASADTSNGVWYFGKDDAGVDVIWYGATAGDNVTFDYSVDRMQFEDISLTMMDNTNLLFGDGSSGAGDFKMYSDGSNLFIAEISSTGKGIEIGVDGKGIDFKMFGETASDYCEFDQSADCYKFEDIDIALGDGTKILFGDPLGTGDFALESSAAVLSLTQIASGVGTVLFGVSDKGIDMTFYGETATRDMMWDQSEDALTFEDSAAIKLGAGNDLVMNATGTTATFKILSGSVLKIEDTDNSASKVTFGLSSGSHGLDIQFNTITSGEDIIFDAADKTLIFDNVDITLEDNDLIQFGDANAEGSIKSDGTDMIITTGTSKNVIVTGGALLGEQETVTNGSPALKTHGATNLDSSGGAITGTLGSPDKTTAAVGQIKTIVMTNSSSSSTVSVSAHVTSDPEVFTFASVEVYLVLMWTGAEWITLAGDAST